MDTAVWAALAIAGLVAGIGIGFWLGRLQKDGDRVAELETELETYREKVTEHFAQSATHFQAIGQQYRELYEHMAAGSEALCAPDAKATMSFPAPGEVSALAEPAAPVQPAPLALPARIPRRAPVEPPVQPAAAATDVDDSEVIETTPYETDALAEDSESAELSQSAEPTADSEPVELETSAEAEEELAERSAEAEDAGDDELAASEETKAEASDDDAAKVPSDAVVDSEPEKRLYH